MIIFSIKNLLLSRGYGQHFLISEIFVLLTVKTKCWGKHLQTFDIKFIFILININLYFSRKTFFRRWSSLGVGNLTVLAETFYCHSGPRYLTVCVMKNWTVAKFNVHCKMAQREFLYFV